MIYDRANILHSHLTIGLQRYSAIGRVKIFIFLFSTSQSLLHFCFYNAVTQFAGRHGQHLWSLSYATVVCIG